MYRKSKSATSVVSTLILFVFAATLSLHAVSFTSKTQAGKDSRHHADFNNDGREDFVVPAPGGFQVILSNGGGTYNTPKFYALPSGRPAADFAIGQFCCSGDIVVVDMTTNFYVYAGHGDGTFTLTTKSVPNGTHPFSIVAGDFNHDGAVDIAYMYYDQNVGSKFIQVLFGPLLSGDFTLGPLTKMTENLPEINEMYVGDFDGDGKADIATEACGVTSEPVCDESVLYGDGQGHFQELDFLVEVKTQLRAADVNGDGKMDLIGLSWDNPVSVQETFFHHIALYKGTASRTWTETKIPTGKCVNGSTARKIAVADFNGDGISDLAFEEYQTATAASRTTKSSRPATPTAHSVPAQ